MKQAGDVNDQTKVFDWVHMWYKTHANAERWEREDTSRLPFDDGNRNVRHPHEIGFAESRRVLAVMYMRVIVRTADSVPGAVVTLRKKFVAANVTTLAGLTAISRLCVPPTRRTNLRAVHVDALISL